jgi:hypothetical protein
MSVKHYSNLLSEKYMDKKITWLHFTDLHYGQKSQNLLWPKIKKELFKDLEFIKDELGKIDIVFFSGDLTQSGKKEEFDDLTALLKEMWLHFKKLGSEPLFIAIPGNHDLTRPDQTKAVVKVLKNYQNDKELQDNFWAGISQKNENYTLIYECFKNFVEWYKEIDLPKPYLSFGLIPGDISAEILINGVKLKIVGLNTAFLELSHDDYLNKLIISPEQIISLTSNNPLDWVEDADISLLLTHHDPNWYDNRSLGYYQNDINPDNLYYSHLCGHLHKANTSESGIVGSKLRKIQLAPSLFGLQKNQTEIDRIHGYYAGNYVFKETNISERFYPRKVQQRYDGSYILAADNGFELQNKNYLDIATPYNSKVIGSQHEKGVVKKELSQTIKTEDTSPIAEQENILDLKESLEISKDLDRIPQFNYMRLAQHSAIRLREQHNFIQFIKEDHFAWLITDWGLNEAGFIGSISEDLKLNKLKSGFILNCEDISNENELLSAFDEQFGMALQRFCNLASGIDNTLLVLDHVNMALYSTSKSYYRLIDIIKSITDFCPRMFVIIIARQAPKHLVNNKYVRLSPLDGSEIRSYLNHFSGNLSELENTENMVKLLEVTSGLPKHIDRIVEGLRVVSFAELLEAEREASNNHVSTDEIPKSLKQAIASLDDPNDRVKQRSLKLLKILTVLSNGETFGNLKKFDGTKPIYPENATLLEQLSLVEIITTNKILSRLSDDTMQQIKLLRAPRQVRDYVNTFITEDERDTILKMGCDMYFGNKWRNGIIKDIYSPVFGASKFLNVDNCHLITNSLMATAIKNDEAFEIERATNLAINFGEYIHEHGDFKNAAKISEEVYEWLKSTNLNRLKAKNAKLYGASLRMAGENEKSILILNEALQIDEANFSNDEKNKILLDLAFTYVSQEKFEKAIELSKIIEKGTTPKSIYYVQAKYIHAVSTLTASELIQKLKTLEAHAKKINSESFVNTISLKISTLESDALQKEKRYKKVLSSKSDDYNKIRAIINKSLGTLLKGETLSDDDLAFLNLAYSYLYSQRLEALFKNCHKALWIYCLNEKRIESLLNLFKHSSLVWRISGEVELEKNYFMELKDKVGSQINRLDANSLNAANIDYYVRRELEFNNQDTPSRMN